MLFRSLTEQFLVFDAHPLKHDLVGVVEEFVRALFDSKALVIKLNLGLFTWLNDVLIFRIKF